MDPAVLRALDRDDRRLLRRVLVLTPLAALAVRAVPIARAVRLLASVPLAPPRTSARRTAHLVHGAGLRLRASCLTRSLVLHALLRRAGLDATLVIGAARDGRRLHAHAWVELEGTVLSLDGSGGCEPLYAISGASAARTPA